MENTKIKISVAMIVKNEEAMLAQCLESVKDADEIIIVDTGSTDKTVSIAEQYAKKIIFEEWRDDFSFARNIARSYCTGDWILSIDADEVLEEGGIEKLREFLKDYTKPAVGLVMKADNNSYHAVRLFKNTEHVYWIGKIHEAINLTEWDPTEVSITYDESPAHTLDPERNMRILQSAYEENPKHPRTLYYLAREYAYKKDWKRCAAYLEKYFPLSLWNVEKADAYFINALCYWNLQEGEIARENVLKAISLNANFKAAILLMAEMSFEKNSIQWKKMAETATNEDVLFTRENFRII